MSGGGERGDPQETRNGAVSDIRTDGGVSDWRRSFHIGVRLAKPDIVVWSGWVRRPPADRRFQKVIGQAENAEKLRDAQARPLVPGVPERRADATLDDAHPAASASGTIQDVLL